MSTFIWTMRSFFLLLLFIPRVFNNHLAESTTASISTQLQISSLLPSVCFRSKWHLSFIWKRPSKQRASNTSFSQEFLSTKPKLVYGGCGLCAENRIKKLRQGLERQQKHMKKEQKIRSLVSQQISLLLQFSNQQRSRGFRNFCTDVKMKSSEGLLWNSNNKCIKSFRNAKNCYLIP